MPRSNTRKLLMGTTSLWWAHIPSEFYYAFDGETETFYRFDPEEERKRSAFLLQFNSKPESVQKYQRRQAETHTPLPMQMKRRTDVRGNR